MNTNPTFWRKLFFAAALFNLSAAALLAFGHRALVIRFGLGPAAEPALYLDLFAFAVALFGCGYYMVSRDLSQTAMVRIGAWAKLGVVGIICSYWLAGQATWHLPLLASGDIAFAAIFFTFLSQQEKRTHNAVR